MRLIANIILAILITGTFSCSHYKSLQSSGNQENQLQIEGEGTDSTEYDIIVTDPGFESWFITNRKPPSYHTKEFLEAKNWNYVIAWNEKVRSGSFQMRRGNDPFIEEIDYRWDIDYGLDVNYKLYYYFKFIEDTWGKF